MRIAIVNDSPTATEMLRRVVCSRPEYTIAWTAVSGEQAVHQYTTDPPDAILMDLLMPGIDGAETTRQIMSRRPCPILVVTATVAGNYALVCQALHHGAFDAVCTPVLGDSPPAEAGASLLAKLSQVDRIRSRQESPSTCAAFPVATEPKHEHRRGTIVAIGASTGGPQALQTILSRWPQGFPAAVLVVQHISAEFAASLADWLGNSCKLPVRTVREGDRPETGSVLVAATDDHLVLRSDGTLGYTPLPQSNPFRPSVDVLFGSLARYERPAVAVLLTGIGSDGARGLLELRRGGCHTIAQDQDSSVVWGMPQAAARLNAAVEVLPLAQIAAAVTRHVGSPLRRIP